MQNNPDLAIVIPVYNEAEIIGEVIKSWDDTVEKLGMHYQIHVYNDGSKDNSIIVLKELALKYPLLFIHDKPNSGHGPTILQGYRENINAEWIFQVDSDNEMRPEKFIEMWSNRQSYDFLIGKRYNRNAPLARRIISRISRFTVWVFYGRGIWDVNSPYRLMRASTFKDIFFSIPIDTFAPNLIISGMAARLNCRILQVKADYFERETGTVSIKKWKLFKVAVKSLLQTCKYSFKRR